MMKSDEEWYASLNEHEIDYKPRCKGLGIRNAIKRKTAVTATSDAFGRAFFKLIVSAAPLTRFPPTNRLIKKAAMLGGTHNTKGHSVPLHLSNVRPGGIAESTPTQEGACAAKTINMDLTVARNIQHAKAPVDMLEESIRRAKHHVVLDSCLCRKIGDCSDYPQDLGCLFLGPAALDCVKRGVGRAVNAEEAMEHVKRAQKAGLSATAYFVELEEYVWGFPDEDMPNVLEICFCCPCCCSAVHFEHRASGELKRILHQGIGWSCVVDKSACTGCGNCARACPHNVMHIKDEKATVGSMCAGCGQCVRACNHGALTVQKTGETKERIEDYFEKLHAKL